MDAQQIKVLIDAMAASDLAELLASKEGWTLRLRRGVGPDAETTAQCAPLSGTVFLQPSPGEPPFVQIGQAVKAGQTLCVIEAMKVFNEVAAERDGVVDAFLVASGEDIDAGQRLVRLR